MPRNTVGVRKSFLAIDWVLVSSIVPILGAGLVTMNSFVGESSLFDRQVVWIGISFMCFFLLSFFDWRFLRRTDVLVGMFIASVFLLVLLFLVAESTKGAQSWFTFGGISFEPADPVKLVLIAILAKYFSRRHIEIAHIRHILVSGFYALVFFVLVLLQPDFGSAIIIFLIWLGMTMVSGISKKHLLIVFATGALAFGVLWAFVFQPYQKARIAS